MRALTVDEKAQQMFLQIGTNKNVELLIQGVSSYILLYDFFVCFWSMHMTQKIISDEK